MIAVSPIAVVRDLLSHRLEVTSIRSLGGLSVVGMRGTIPAPGYLLAEQAFQRGLLSIEEIGGGDVQNLVAVNQADTGVLLLDGEHLEGAKQNRVLSTTILLAPMSKTVIPVACVEQGRWSARPSRGFGVAKDMAYAQLRALKRQQLHDNFRTGGGHRVDQGRVWQDVARVNAATGAPSQTGWMGDAYEVRRHHLDELGPGLLPQDGDAGVIVYGHGRPIALDVFDSPATLQALWPRLLSGYFLEVDQGRHEPPTPDEVLAFVREGLGAEFSLHPSVGLGDDVALASPSVVGGALVAGDRVIHLSMFPGAEYGRGLPRNRSGQIARPRDRQRHFHSAG